MPETATLEVRGKKYSLPVVVGTENEVAVDISKLRAESGVITLDDGYGNTGSCQSAITFIDGEQGILRYRGIPIEELAGKSTFPEAAWLIIYGELPTAEQLQCWSNLLTKHEMLHEGLYKHYDGFPAYGHPMAILSAMINAASTYSPDIIKMESPETFQDAAARLLSKTRTIAAAAYKTSIGQPLIYPKSHLDYVSNFLHMMFSIPNREYEPDPDVVEALSLILVLHADHEQNCSTSTVRMVASSGANLFASCAAGVCALWGPLHGGANAAVLEMLQYIHDSGVSVKDYVARVKDKSSNIKLMGFGHRVYKNYDPAREDHQAGGRPGARQAWNRRPAARHRAPPGRGRAQRPVLQGEEALPERGLLLRDHHARHRDPRGHVHGHVRHRPHARLDRELEGSLGRAEPHLPPAADLRRADPAPLRLGRRPEAGRGGSRVERRRGTADLPVKRWLAAGGSWLVHHAGGRWTVKHGRCTDHRPLTTAC